MKNDIKGLFLEAFIGFIEVFASENIGGDFQLDYGKILNYISSHRFELRDGWEINTLDDCYQMIEQWVLDGEPIWHFLKLSTWTKEMLNREFLSEAALQKQQDMKKFKCLTCANLKTRTCSLGTIYDCKYRQDQRERCGCHSRESFDPYKIRNNCKGYNPK